MAQHHIPEDWLIAYAAGEVDEAVSALIAAHLTFCPLCRRKVEDFEIFGGAVLDSIDIGDEGPDLTAGLAAARQSISDPAPGDTAPTAAEAGETPAGTLAEIAPRPLLDYARSHGGGIDIDALPWRPYAPGIKRAVLFRGEDGQLVRFLKAKPGARFPHHDHGGDEFTIVLTGAYRDRLEEFHVGDVQHVGENEEHQPVIIGEEICIGFVVSQKPPIPTTFLPRLISRFIE